MKRRDDGEGETPARHRAAAEDALRDRPSGRGAHVVAPGDEGNARPEPDQRAKGNAEDGVRRREEQSVARRHDEQGDERHGKGAVAVGEAPARDLHEGMDEKERRGEEPDDAETDPVRVRKRLGDGADVGDVPADRQPHERPAQRGRAGTNRGGLSLPSRPRRGRPGP